MRDAHRLGALLLLSAGCNEVLGLTPGKAATGGNAGEPPAGAGAEANAAGVTSDLGGSAGRGGTAGGPSGAAGDAGDASAGDDTGRGGSSAGNGTGGGTPGSCSKNADCSRQGFDWPPVCQRGRCVDITSDDCPIVMGAENLSPTSEPLIFGALVPGAEPAKVGTYSFYYALKLAMDEFFSSAEGGGIPIGGVARRPLLILCTDTVSSEGWLYRSLDHLIETVHVPGIIAITTPVDLRLAAQRTLYEKGEDVFFLHHAGSDAALANLDDDGRVWHMLGNELDLAPTYVPLVERIEANVNPQGISGGRATRLVLLEDGIIGFYGAGNRVVLNSTLRINGALAADQLDENYFVVSQAGSTWLEIGERVAELEPDIIVDLSGTYDGWYFAESAIQQRGSRLPFYVFAGAVFEPAFLIDLLYYYPDLRTRVVGVNTAAADDPTMYNAYLNRVQFDTPSVVNMAGTENFYDPIYYLFYAAAAEGTSGTLGGADLGRGMLRLISGDRYEIGPQRIAETLELLVSNPEATIGFHATMGAPVFDADAGQRIINGSVFCIREDSTIAWDQLSYDRKTMSLSGDFDCFDF